MIATDEWTSVPTAAGELRAWIQVPEHAAGPLPGVVLVDGSGEGAADDWGEWPGRFLSCGAVVLMHDKPGCGGSPGEWLTQTFLDRAHESLSALQVLRAHPAVAGQAVGLLGFSQGGWVSLLAASLDPTLVDFVISISGPGVGTAQQDRYRIERELRSRGIADEDVDEALAWIDERGERLTAGESAAAVLADQERHRERAWSAYAKHLPPLPGDPHGIASFPGADHGLFTADPDPDVPRTDQLAAGFLPMLAAFLGERARN